MLELVRSINLQGIDMKEDEFQKQIDALKNKIQTLPLSDQVKMREMIQRTSNQRSELSSVLESMKEKLQYLSLTVKYMAFDLESTKRENQKLRDTLHKYGHGDDMYAV